MVFVAGLIQPGDIVLTTTPDPVSQTIRTVAGADISHAMNCVGKSSVSILLAMVFTHVTSSESFSSQDALAMYFDRRDRWRLDN